MSRIGSFLAAICVVAAPMAHATSVQRIRNHKVVVTEVTLAPGESEAAPEKLPSLMVYMTDGMVLNGTVRNTTEPRHVFKGEIVQFSGPTSGIRNVGDAPLHLARIEFLTSGSGETWGKTGLPPNYLLMRDDQYSRTYTIRIPAGAYEQRHTHHARAVVTLQGAELEHILPDGTKQPSTLRTGEIVWREGATHTGHNMGKTDLWVVAVEPK